MKRRILTLLTAHKLSSVLRPSGSWVGNRLTPMQTAENDLPFMVVPMNLWLSQASGVIAPLNGAFLTDPRVQGVN